MKTRPSNNPAYTVISHNKPLRRFGAGFIILAISIALLFSSPLWTTIFIHEGSTAPSQALAQDDPSSQTDTIYNGILIGDNDTVNKTVKAGVFAFDGYHMMDDDGNLYGYGIEVLEMISKYSHLNFDLVGFESSWNETLTMLENGDIDVATSASKTAEREEKFDYSLPIGKKSTVLSVRVNDTRFTSGDYKTYEGMIIGEIPGNTSNNVFSEFANDKGFGYTVKEYSNNDDLVAALQNEEVDAIITSNLRKTENEKALETIEDDNYYAIVRKGDTELLSEINYAIEQMNINEGDWKNILYYKYYGPHYSNELEFTEREQEYINEVKSGQKKITATAFSDRRPYSYVDNGKLTGILLDYFAAVMDVADLPYEILVPRNLNEYEQLIEYERVNVVLDGITGDYSSTDYFSDGFSSEIFMAASVVQVTRTDFTGEIHSIAVSDSSTGSLDAFFASQSGKELLHYPSREAALQAVLDGQADCAYVYIYTAQEFMNRDLTNSLSYHSVYGLDIQFDMRISANTDHELVSILNKCIKQIPESTLGSLIADYTSYKVTDLTVGDYLLANPIIIIAILLVVLVIILIFVYLILRGKWHQRLLTTQAESNHMLQEQLSIVQALSRDYANVYSINEAKGTAKIIKLEGYVTEGLDPESEEEFDYMTLLNNYINARVYSEDRKPLLKEMSLDTVRRHMPKDAEYSGTYRILEDGTIHTYQYTYVKADSDKGDFLIVGFRNIDDVVRKEQEQKEVLSEALAQAQYANQAKTTFLNNMSHDIRTPMNAIIGFTALAGTHIDNTEQVQNYLGKIMTSSNHLLSLINDVLDMSRIESGKVKIENKETSLPEVMHDLRTIVQADIRAKGLEFYIDMLGVTDEIVICDKLRLNQVLLNILSNAIKYTKPGGIVSVRITEKDADPQTGTAEYQFIVKDTGIGMSKEFLAHVFEPFEREETATVSGIQGTGLGLAITKNIVDIMGGTIEVSSVEGEGSEFTVTFRFKTLEGAEPFTPPEELKDLRALVVDDDVDTCTSVSSMLLTIGMRPDWTTLGEEAIAHTEFAEEQNDPYSAFIIDWIMPNMSGLEIVKRIRRIIGDETPIIIATAYDWTEVEQEAKDAGVTAICSKPIFLSELREILMRPFQEGVPDTGELIVAHENSATEIIQDAFDDAIQQLSGRHILLAEDNEMNREIARTVLEDAQIVVDTVEDGIYAVERIKEVPAGTYDAILMDVQMPQMDGYEATRNIRALDDPEKASIPIIAVTANAFEEDREKAENAGMSGYIPKPIEINKLFEALEHLLND